MFETLVGNESKGLAPMTREQIVAPFLQSFASPDPTDGGCAEVPPCSPPCRPPAASHQTAAEAGAGAAAGAPNVKPPPEAAAGAGVGVDAAGAPKVKPPVAGVGAGAGTGAGAGAPNESPLPNAGAGADVLGVPKEKLSFVVVGEPKFIAGVIPPARIFAVTDLPGVGR